MVSHRSGETEDTFIADLVVGLCAGQVRYTYNGSGWGRGGVGLGEEGENSSKKKTVEPHFFCPNSLPLPLPPPLNTPATQATHNSADL